MNKTKFTTKKTMGKRDGLNIYLSPPSWDCGWYWGFGYLGNKDCHYHVDGLKKHQEYNKNTGSFEYEFTNIFDGIKKHFGKTLCAELQDDKTLWKFCELMQTFYTLKETAEVFGRGGSYYTENPIKNKLIDKKKVKEINEIIMPALFDEIEALFN